MFSHACVCSQGDWVCQVQGPFLEGGYVQRDRYVQGWVCPDGVYVQGIGGIGYVGDGYVQGPDRGRYSPPY